jgi:transposase
MAEEATARVTTRKETRGRMATAVKVELVLAVLKGKSEDAAAREAGVGTEAVKDWREKFVTAGETALRGGKGKGGEDKDVKWMRQKLGELLIENERLRDRSNR